MAPSTKQLAAIVVMAAGIGSLAMHDDGPPRRSRHSLIFALATAAFIAGHTVSDGLGARRSGAAHSYVVWLFALNAVPISAVALVARRRDLASALRAGWKPGLAGGAMSVAAYGLVIRALTLGLMGPVAALRETSVLFAALIGSLYLGERGGSRRVVSTALVAGGTVLLYA